MDEVKQILNILKDKENFQNLNLKEIENKIIKPDELLYSTDEMILNCIKLLLEIYNKTENKTEFVSNFRSVFIDDIVKYELEEFNEN